MTTQAQRADGLLQESGHGGLWEWAMEQRRTVRPPNWGELAYRLLMDTGGAVQIKGEMLRKWLLVAEAERDTDSPNDQA
ncbi:hypothetical protein [Brachybacterium alimentarium]|uniref:hypothetical protein n=1 Tax=Brachybacterium alimentarium TaxID=47845 RepID=UPI003FD4B313